MASAGARTAIGAGVLASVVALGAWTLRSDAPRAGGALPGVAAESSDGARPADLAGPAARERDAVPSARRPQAQDFDARAFDGPPERAPDPTTEAPIHGALVDAATGEGLAGWCLSVAADASLHSWRGEQVVTGPGGGFKTRRSYPAASYDLRAWPQACEDERHDRPAAGLSARHEVRAGVAEALVVEHRSGPSYRVHATLPAGTTPCEYRAHLWSRADGREVAGPARIEAGDELAVRFTHPARDSRGPWLLALRSRDERYAGTALVEAVSGACAEPVELSIEPRAKLRGRVLAAEGEPAPRVTLRYLPDAPADPGFEGEVRTGDSGRYAFSLVPPGPGVLVVESSAQRLELPLALEPLEERALDVRLAELRFGALTGRVVADDGPIEHPPRLTLRAVHDPRRELARVLYERDEDGGLRFVCEPLAHGDYELVLEPVDGRAWEAAPRVARVPGAEVLVRRLAGERELIVLDVLAAEDGAPLEGAWGVAVGADGLATSRAVPGGVLIDLDAALERVYVGAPSRRVAALAPGALARNGRFLSATVELARGDEALVRVVDERGEPLAGAPLTAGDATALTDAHGLALLPAAADAAAIGIELDGWRLVERREGCPLVLELARTR